MRFKNWFKSQTRIIEIRSARTLTKDRKQKIIKKYYITWVFQMHKLDFLEILVLS